MKTVLGVLAMLVVFCVSVFPQTTANLTDVKFIGTKGYAVGSSGTILFTADSGKTWTNQTSGTARTLSSVFFFDKDSGWAVGSNALFGNNVIIRTKNTGTTWTGQASGVTGTFNGVATATGEIAVIVGKNSVNQGLILRTTNHGTT